MPNPRLAYRYAKSLIDLAVEQNQLETVHADMQYMKAVCSSSREFTALLRSPVVTSDKKLAITNAITKDKISALAVSFNTLLINKGRESDLPEITDAFIQQYNEIKGIHKVKLVTAVEMGDAVKHAITAKIKNEAGLQNVELETVVDDSIIGGFKLEFNNNLVDASVLRDLNDIRKQFSHNVFVQNIR